MATAEQIAELRLLIAEPTGDVYTDAILGTMIDARSGDMNGSAYDVWVQKAAAAAELVDISEGGSSRKMGDVYEQALSMARHFASATPGGVTPEAPRYPRLTKLRRP
jgi:hypothetical protein